MHKLIDYVCDELEELEHKADKGDLSAAEIQYADTLAHLKKNLLKSEEMEGYSGYYPYSYARRDMRGRYSRSAMSDKLRELMDTAPESMRGDIERLMHKAEQM